MLTRVKNTFVPSITAMHDIAIRYIFERANVTLTQTRILETGIEIWSKKVDLNASDRWELKRIVNALIADEKGYFDRSKMLQIKHKFHYRQLYKCGLPFVDVDHRTSFNKK